MSSEDPDSITVKASTKADAEEPLNAGSSDPAVRRHRRSGSSTPTPSLDGAIPRGIDIGLHESQVGGGEVLERGENGVEAGRGNAEPGGQGSCVLRRGDGRHPAPVGV